MTDKRVVRVSEVMEQDYVVIDGLATVAEALGMLDENDASVVIVGKRHEDDELGIVLISDIARKVLAPHRAPERTNVYEIMSKPVLAVRPRMDIRYCARLFERFGIAVAPVVEGDEIQGIVSYDQLVLKGLARSRGE